MPRIQYLTDGRTIEIGTATTLLRASLDHGIAHTHVCGGNAVNLARRIESVNKGEDTTLLVSGSAWEKMRDAARCGRVLEVPLKGKSGTYPLYEVTALAGACA